VARSFSTLSIRWRLTATYVALVVAIVLVLGLALYRGLESFLLDDVAARTTADVQRVVARELDKKPAKDPAATPAPKPTKKPAPGATGATGSSAAPTASPGGLGTVSAAGGGGGEAGAAASAPAPARGTVEKLGRTLVTEIGGRDTSVVVLWPDRSVIAASAPIPDVAPWPVATLDEVDIAIASGQAVRRLDGGREPRAMLLVDTIRADDGTVLAVTAVATSLEGGDSALAQLRLALILGLIAAIVLGVALGLPVTRIALRPLDRVVGAAQRITAGDRGVRVGAADVPTEIGRLGVAFDTMVDRLEASAGAQRRFVADASHELRTPLAALGGMTEMLLLGIDQGDEAAVERVLTAMNREIARLGRLAGDLLLLSQLEDRGGRLPLVIGEVPIAEVAGEVVAELDGVLDGRLVSVDVPSGLVVAGDRDRLKQVLLNLVENAGRHTEVAGSIVVAAAREANVGDGGGTAVRISVTDDGTGLAAADVDRIFDRFFRTDRARVGGGGAGLGLSIVRAIAEAQGGHVEASSRGLGLGTTVSVVIPDAGVATSRVLTAVVAPSQASQDVSGTSS
jgi:two-component system OmpR family sensor kinase